MTTTTDAAPPRPVFGSPTPTFSWGEVVWYNVIILSVWHAMAVYTLFFVLPQASFVAILTLWVGLWFFSGLGITAGAHRLWAHRSYKARLPLQIFLALCNSMAFQGSIYEWSRDHRVHHKGSDTTADPHNSRRGFFFAHMGWVMVRKHADVFREGKKMNFADLDNDKLVQFQKKHYLASVLLMCYVFPSIVGYLCFDSAWQGFWIGGVYRHVWVLHMTWCVNSVAHFFGYKPYDRNSRAVENLFVSIGAIGEGWHNYHHRYPTDYATGEMGVTGQWNPTKGFIDLMASVGLAYDMKRSTTAAATREKNRIAVDREILKGVLQPPSSIDQFVNWLFFGRTEDQSVF
ncbi:hypothetical protein H257_13981 [Aphanomyces astaci]|uniref:Fatty acid desaturase domain-containing protein n=2 Tax=Aphanomyces astaci TaxID=112090 RepID=W4FT28_APHAT|nr:hypothetical protein H257_13981 [Aphanomyces astaci]ETV70607.1 hypothetical protein H257_13981 [Aphanomyces astaci]KAF0760133.1 hypothetical protein AaE_003614 [Aphanomyces astaci]RHY04431.1 hypothetical protein DYB36_003956 [Aphanomyces astaci]RHY08314.1 hypothetical protein DYB25_014021 [Aphanomyces astaci]RHY48625.1 hypothetical protein DYB34_010401 [Aphanomyces astaci]|eukprot:XP_009839990.1 hypothetical protein H257_13981 [Aphanomyces astaci]